MRKKVERPLAFMYVFLVLPQNVRGLTSLGLVWGLVGNMGEISWFYPPKKFGSVSGTARRLISACDPSGRIDFVGW